MTKDIIDRLFSAARPSSSQNFAEAGRTGAREPGPFEKASMALALRLMRQAGVIDGTGGPFGAVVVRGGELLAACGNSVLADNDPTAHAEINAIRKACAKVGSPHLDGATLFTSCECCPMCYAAAYWARVGMIYYAASWTDYADLFDDGAIAADMEKPLAERSIRVTQMMRSEAVEVWRDYRALPARRLY